MLLRSGHCTLLEVKASVFSETSVAARRKPVCGLREGSRWSRRVAELHELAEPVLESPAVQRLATISFLGILSPRFAHLHLAPLYRRAGEEPLASREEGGDGSRLDHSVGVALLNVDVVRSLGFGIEAQRYAAVWGLLHDLGNWPLSHTGEGAFRRLAGRSTRALRRELITGEGVALALPQYSVRDRLGAAGLQVDRLLALMEYRMAELPTELRALAEVVQSPLSPDAFEGMWRCGQALGAPVVDPEHLARGLARDATGSVVVRQGYEELALQFWRSKMHLYRSFLNTRAAIELESSWAEAIAHAYPGLTAADSLILSEASVVKRVQDRCASVRVSAALGRYKPPVDYDLALPPTHRLPNNATMSQLSSLFVSKPLAT